MAAESGDSPVHLASLPRPREAATRPFCFHAAGANWTLVAAFVDHTARLKRFVPRPSGGAAKRVAAELIEAEAAAPGSPSASERPAKDGKEGRAPAGQALTRKSLMASLLEPEGNDDYEVPFLPRWALHPFPSRPTRI